MTKRVFDEGIDAGHLFDELSRYPYMKPVRFEVAPGGGRCQRFSMEEFEDYLLIKGLPENGEGPIEIDRQNGDEFHENGRKRSDSDLDSITVGVPSIAQVKLYVNSKSDKQEEIEQRISMLVCSAKYLSDQLKRAGLGGKRNG